MVMIGLPIKDDSHQLATDREYATD